MRPASRRAIGVVRPLLRLLSSGMQVHSLYPAGHPQRLEAVGELLAHVQSLRHATEGDPVLFIARGSFYLGSTLLARESLSLFRLVEGFEEAGIQAVEFAEGVSAPDLVGLIDLLAGERPLEDRIGALVINRIKPKLATGPAGIDLSQLRREYGRGLEFLRDTSARVASGDEVALDEASTLVEGIADNVIADPTRALLLTTVKSYDEYTYYHMLNVCLLTIALGQALGLRKDQVTVLGIGALLHDVGKVHMPEDVLTHVGRLSEEQWRIVQKHPVDGASMVFRTGEGLFHPAAAVVLEHHSAFDLSGYPRLSRREHPSVPARLVSVADCFDAVTSKRAYRSPAHRAEALEIMQSGAGSGFDPRLVRVFTALMGLFPVGTPVELDTGEVGLVIRSDPQHAGRPDILVVLDATGSVVTPEERSLTTQGPDGYRWSVVRTRDAAELGIDVVDFLTTGELTPADPDAPGPGLVHEPSFGEQAPEGYVDTHHDHPHPDPDPDAGQRPDPDVAPPIDLPGDDDPGRPGG